MSPSASLLPPPLPPIYASETIGRQRKASDPPSTYPPRSGTATSSTSGGGTSVTIQKAYNTNEMGHMEMLNLFYHGY